MSAPTTPPPEPSAAELLAVLERIAAALEQQALLQDDIRGHIACLNTHIQYRDAAL